MIIFSVATATNQQHKQYGILSDSTSSSFYYAFNMQVFKRYKSTSHMTTVNDVILMLPFSLALYESSLLLILPGTILIVLIEWGYVILLNIAYIALHFLYSTHMILVLSYNYNGIIFTFENVSIICNILCSFT